ELVGVLRCLGHVDVLLGRSHAQRTGQCRTMSSMVAPAGAGYAPGHVVCGAGPAPAHLSLLARGAAHRTEPGSAGPRPVLGPGGGAGASALRAGGAQRGPERGGRRAAYARGDVLMPCVRPSRERFDDPAISLCTEAGKPIKDSGGGVTRLIDTFRIAAEEAP